MAILTPTIRSIRAISRSTLPVMVGEGYPYAPVRIRQVIPSSLKALAFARRFSRLLVIPSVPKSPTTVVMPFLTSTLRLASGTLVAGPLSPPPPVMWTWISMYPGVRMCPPRSTFSTSSIWSYSSIWSAILAMRLPSIRISFLPRCSGAYISPCFNTFMDSFPLFQQNHYSMTVIYMCLLYY